MQQQTDWHGSRTSYMYRSKNAVPQQQLHLGSEELQGKYAQIGRLSAESLAALLASTQCDKCQPLPIDLLHAVEQY